MLRGSRSQGEVLGEVVLDRWDDGLNELEEDDEVHVNPELAASLHDLKNKSIV